MQIQNRKETGLITNGKKPSTGIAVPHTSAVRRMAGLAWTVAVAIALLASTASAQNTQVTIQGAITSVGSVSGIAVGDKYTMVVYYNPTQAPALTIGSGEAYYSSYTLSAVVDDPHGTSMDKPLSC